MAVVAAACRQNNCYKITTRRRSMPTNRPCTRRATSIIPPVEGLWSPALCGPGGHVSDLSQPDEGFRRRSVKTRTIVSAQRQPWSAKRPQSTRTQRSSWGATEPLCGRPCAARPMQTTCRRMLHSCPLEQLLAVVLLLASAPRTECLYHTAGDILHFFSHAATHDPQLMRWACLGSDMTACMASVGVYPLAMHAVNLSAQATHAEYGRQVTCANSHVQF
eukprot:352421-Chlamydomonas_euryale.AAC.26